MSRRASRKIMAWLMLVAMVFTMDLTAVFAADVFTKLKNVTVSATQNGTAITDTTVLDFDKPISIQLEFQVPVKGDGDPDESKWVKQGDTASIELAKGFKVTSGNGPFDLEQDGVKIGTLTLETTGSGIEAVVTAEIVFNGADGVFNGIWKEVICTANATLEYDGPGPDVEDGDHII